MDWSHSAINDIESKSTRRSEADKYRGTQWRLVIAYSSFEIAAKGLMNNFERKTDPEKIAEFINKCTLASYKPLDSPNSTRNRQNLEKWLSKGEEAIADFLGVSAGDAKIIKRWIVESKTVSSRSVIDVEFIGQNYQFLRSHPVAISASTPRIDTYQGFEPQLIKSLRQLLFNPRIRVPNPCRAPSYYYHATQNFSTDY